jgi:hypothetical protein
MSLWPADINQPLDLKSPYLLIKKQASELGIQTNNIVEAIVSEVSTKTKAQFAYAFYLHSSITNYSYRLFSFYFDIDFYPVTLRVDEEISQEVDLNPGDFITNEVKVNNEEELNDYLKLIFSSQKTKRVVSALYKMADPDDKPTKQKKVPF